MSLFLDAIAKRPVDRAPIWIMRQAGRYLPEYREIRARAGSFMTLCKTPELACEVTLQPIQRYGFDAAILFSDILTIPDAMGLGLSFETGHGPRFERAIDSVGAIQSLGIPDPQDDLGYVMSAIKLTKSHLSIPLIGFSGSPWTLAAYMVQGEANKAFPKLIALKDEDPKALHQLLDLLAEAVIAYLRAQIESGVDAVMIFDTWGGMLSTPDYKAFSLAYLHRIVAGIQAETASSVQVPIIVFTKGGGEWLEIMAESGCDMLGIDWHCDLAEAKRRVGARVAVQGNLDPALLTASDDVLVTEIQKCLSVYQGESGYVFNLGHGITPDIDPEKVKLMVEVVKNYGK